MTRPVSRPRGLSDTAALVRGAFIVVGVVVLTLLAWQLVSVALLFFGAILVAIMLRSVAALIERALPLSTRWSLVAACLLILALGVGVSVLLGAQLIGQMTTLVEEFPQQIDALGDRLGIVDLGSRLAEQAQSFASRGNVLQSVAGYTSGLLGVLTNIVLVLVGGVYLAARPDFYLKGCLRVFPASIRDNVASATENAGRALQLWLLGQLVSMLLIGLFTTAGLYFIGMPSAFVLGLIAGLAEFVPVVGPIVGAVPALVIALSQGGSAVFWVLGLYVVVQQVESNLIMPLVQRRTVHLPPVLALFALLPLAVLFGPVGVVLGTPLTVVFYVALKQLYLRDTLHQKTEVPGEETS
ncbi:AI-2E family transporter [Ancylobacter mangrovi]|uniref:AI-2E family transporter n=1 Tax=Ancylobacter mangrovi TaxID=2972472 RepID=UPI002163BA1F|nr:AI-2E family transporter [Ancylobacter mangrovi]MCS0501245.1 AI-2E family transporter [Ancylobacter mangrovi]